MEPIVNTEFGYYCIGTGWNNSSFMVANLRSVLNCWFVFASSSEKRQI